MPDGPRWDQHMHSHYSWDAPRGQTLLALCEAAVDRGLDGIAVTDHFDSFPSRRISNRRPVGVFGIPSFLGDVADARKAYPHLGIHSGLEYGEPHLDLVQAQKVRRSHSLDLILGSVHSLIVDDELMPVEHVITDDSIGPTMTIYLDQVLTMVSTSPIDVLAHLEYPLRAVDSTLYDAAEHSAQYTRILETICARGIALEYNTRSAPMLLTSLWPIIDRFPLLSFTTGSDAHHPDRVGDGIDIANEVLGSHGFRGCRVQLGRRCRHRDCAHR